MCSWVRVMGRPDSKGGSVATGKRVGEGVSVGAMVGTVVAGSGGVGEGRTSVDVGVFEGKGATAVGARRGGGCGRFGRQVAGAKEEGE